MEANPFSSAYSQAGPCIYLPVVQAREAATESTPPLPPPLVQHSCRLTLVLSCLFCRRERLQRSQISVVQHTYGVALVRKSVLQAKEVATEPDLCSAT